MIIREYGLLSEKLNKEIKDYELIIRSRDYKNNTLIVTIKIGLLLQSKDDKSQFTIVDSWSNMPIALENVNLLTDSNEAIYSALMQNAELQAIIAEMWKNWEEN